MRVQAADGEWGSIQTEPCGQNVRFYAEGKKTDKVWRIWGILDEKEPLLIGVPEPENEHMVLRRTLSQEFLSRCGYWPSLPERYVIGESPELAFPFAERKQTKQSAAIQTETRGDYQILRCSFAPDRPFLLAYLFCFCRIHGATAEVWIETKTGRPLWNPPE